ncbi:MAG: acyltransferase family protein [Desulfuromonadaceae bacterium]
MTQQTKPVSKRIPCLDGIRAISISLVLLAHFIGTVGQDVPKWILPFTKMGNLGVRIFFVISGFLITTLLISEYKKTGTISLLKFYFNRTFRIFPAFYAFIFAILIASALGFISLKEGDLLHAVTYTTNYHHDRAWELGHLWSLAVEEQFYLLWPAMFLLFGMRGALFCSTAYLVIGPVVRVLTWKYFPDDRIGIGESFETIADAIATGCVFGFIKTKLGENDLFTRIQSSGITVVGLICLIVTLDHFGGSISIMYPIGQTILNLSIVLFIDWCLRNSTSYLGKFLEARPLVFVGVLSYSLYLWQQPFLIKHSSAFVTSAPINIVIVFFCALLSYYLVPCNIYNFG